MTEPTIYDHLRELPTKKYHKNYNLPPFPESPPFGESFFPRHARPRSGISLFHSSCPTPIGHLSPLQIAGQEIAGQAGNDGMVPCTSSLVMPDRLFLVMPLLPRHARPRSGTELLYAKLPKESTPNYRKQ